MTRQGRPSSLSPSSRPERLSPHSISHVWTTSQAAAANAQRAPHPRLPAVCPISRRPVSLACARQAAAGRSLAASARQQGRSRSANIPSRLLVVPAIRAPSCPFAATPGRSSRRATWASRPKTPTCPSSSGKRWGHRLARLHVLVSGHTLSHNATGACRCCMVSSSADSPVPSRPFVPCARAAWPILPTPICRERRREAGQPRRC